MPSAPDDRAPAQLLRLNRYLALAGWGARRKCDELIATGRVSVNGTRVAEPGVRVDTARDRVAVDGEAARLPKPIMLVMHKPASVLVTRDDPHGRRTIFDIVQSAGEGLFPVGRLDRDSEGLLLLTNDGDLAFRLTHPRFGVERKYLVTVKGDVSPEKLRRLERGVVLDDGPTAPARVRFSRGLKTGAVLDFSLREGRNREVRRMCAAVGLFVTKLVRVSYGPLRLEGMPPGAWRKLRNDELEALRKFADEAEAAAAAEPQRRRPRPGPGARTRKPVRRRPRGASDAPMPPQTPAQKSTWRRPTKDGQKPEWKRGAKDGQKPEWKRSTKDGQKLEWKRGTKDGQKPAWKRPSKAGEQPEWKRAAKDDEQPAWKRGAKDDERPAWKRAAKDGRTPERKRAPKDGEKPAWKRPSKDTPKPRPASKDAPKFAPRRSGGGGPRPAGPRTRGRRP
ncbi:MAG: pseudouridine synthase [bacterium]